MSNQDLPRTKDHESSITRIAFTSFMCEKGEVWQDQGMVHLFSKHHMGVVTTLYDYDYGAVM